MEYRETLAASFFFKFFVYVKQCLAKDGVNEVSCICQQLFVLFCLFKKQKV